IITTDLDGSIEQVNFSCYGMFGYTAATLHGRHWSELLADPNRIDELYSATSSAKNEYETVGRRRDESLFPMAVNRSLVRLQQQPKQLLVMRDLSERYQTEQLKQQFISTVSHELRTPLTSISGAVGLTVSGALGELSASQQRMLKLAQDNCQQLSILVNDLLDVEKISSGTMTMHMAPTALFPLLKQAIEDNRLLKPEVSLQLTCPASLTSVVVNADSNHLHHVIRHVLSNAIKFSPTAGTVLIDISCDGNQIMVSMQDEGEGVPEQFVPRLFSRFTQADSSDSRHHGGTGLGLAISRSLINQMGGNMGYKPLQPRGSCFYFVLPFIEHIQPNPPI
ncbi:MAG TPA: ATP-binding protein, partial [Rheinheimera sp.]|nr:ATP-binding protein [Rheinheimera sp.]